MITKEELEKKIVELQEEIEKFRLESNAQLAFYQGKLHTYRELMQSCEEPKPQEAVNG